MRTLEKRSTVMTIALLAALALPSTASALTIDLEWSGSGTALTSTAFTGSVSLGVYFSYAAPPPTVQAVVVSLNWDSDDLSLVSCNLINKIPGNTSGKAKWSPTAGAKADCPTPSPGLQPGIDQLAFWAPHTVGDTVQIGTLVFHVATQMVPKNILVTPFMSINDGWADGNWTVSFNAVFNDATVHVIPEPATAMLVGAGFIGLLAAGRRRRRN